MYITKTPYVMDREVCQKGGLFYRGVAAANHSYLPAFEKEAITDSTGAHAASSQTNHPGDEPLRAGSSRDDYGAYQARARVGGKLERPLVEINGRDMSHPDDDRGNSRADCPCGLWDFQQGRRCD